MKDFSGFVSAGRVLADLHLAYDTAASYDLAEVTSSTLADDYEQYAVIKMAFPKGPRVDGQATTDKSRLVYNARITLEGIPHEAHRYRVGARSALEWLVDRYQVKVDKPSGIPNDPNDWAREHEQPRYIIDLVKRVVTVSVETVTIVDALPPLDIIESS